MFCATDRMLIRILLFNMSYQKQEIGITIDSISPLRDIYQIVVSDIDYWNDTGVVLETIDALTGKLESAILQSDWVYVYDKLNYEVAYLLRAVLKTLFDKSAPVLKNWIWEENKIALRERYPDIYKQLMEVDCNEEKRFVRSYGLRGSVVYRKNEQIEYDLYSSYDPEAFGALVGQELGLEKFKKWYILGFHGAYDCSGVYWRMRKVNIEIYVVNIAEFKLILQNTLRKGFLLNPDVEWRFHLKLQDFFNNIDLSAKDDSYIYVTEYAKEELPYIREFIKKNALNSNIG